jgi:Sugar (and other) transporter.
MSSTSAKPVAGELTKGHKKVIFASSLGTVFEWYDFYLYGSLAIILSRQFFSGVNPTTGMIFTLLAFAAGFFVRPFGAAFFGSLGDRIGRKYTFLVTILIMGFSTFLVGVLPSYASIGIAAPIMLIVLRLPRAWPWVVSMVALPPTWPSMPRRASAACTPASSRPPPRWACSCR